MNPWLFLVLWSAGAVAIVAFAVHAAVQLRRLDNAPWPLSFLAAALAAFFPLVTLAFFVAVFVIGGSHSTAQIAGESGLDLWSVWFHAWPALFIGNPGSLAIGILTLFAPPYSLRLWALLGMRLAVVSTATFSWYAVVQWFPDA